MAMLADGDLRHVAGQRLAHVHRPQRRLRHPLAHQYRDVFRAQQASVIAVAGIDKIAIDVRNPDRIERVAGAFQHVALDRGIVQMIVLDRGGRFHFDQPQSAVFADQDIGADKNAVVLDRRLE
ncbi:MAG: hypothetical protein ACR2FI_04205 [Burkholderiales bacterium]